MSKELFLGIGLKNIQLIERSIFPADPIEQLFTTIYDNMNNFSKASHQPADH